MSVGEIKKQIEGLTRNEQGELAHFLRELIDDGAPGDISPEWLEELGRRGAEIDRGEVELVPWETVRDEIRRIV